MTKRTFGAIFALGFLLPALAAAATATPPVGGEYLRKDDQEIAVTVKDNALFCTRVSDGFEMCHGMTLQPDGSWKGGHMKHPDMPSFMTFNGTVTFAADSMTIKGCALGMCDSEVWAKKPKK